MPKLIPAPYSEQLAGFARDYLERERTRREHVRERQRTLRPEIGVQVPIDPEWLAARDAFGVRWQTLTDEGLAAGYLDYGYDQDVVVTTHTTRTEWRPNPDYEPPTQEELAAADSAGRPRYITIPIVRGGRIDP